MSNPSGVAKSHEPIAIIGMACRFPGDANDPVSFWELLKSGREAITEIPADRWSLDRCYHAEPGAPGRSYTRWGGFTKGIDQFETECFGISPREAAYIDPQQRLLLEVAWEAIEDGGWPVEKLAGSDTGVFIGISSSDYADIQVDPYRIEGFDPHSGTGIANCIAANRISYCLNLLGPSLAVDTACSSSLVATHLACRSLWDGECEMALAGGVNVLLTPGPFVCFCAASMLSPTGRCKAFDAGADGFVRAEGAGAVLLEPLSRALAKGDPVYALLVGTAVNQDGRTLGISAPSQASQEELLRTACRQAGVAPKDICYVEAHGTGTAVGDPIETTALGNVLSEGRPDGECCVIGSVKTNIGHMEAGAGMAGLIKACLMVKHRQIPPSLHFTNPNPAIRFRELKLRVPVSLEPLVSSGPAVLGVNSFGFGGTNAHAVVKEFRPIDHNRSGIAVVPPNRRRRRSDADAREGTGEVGAGAAALLPLSARSPEALETLARAYLGFLSDEGARAGASLLDICYTAAARRTHYDHRLALAVRNEEELVERLEAFVAGESRQGMHTGQVASRRPKVAFVFSGQGPQWWAMGRELLESEAPFRAVIEECERWVRKYGNWSLLEELTRDGASSRLEETAIAQPALCALQMALAAVWASWGVVPDAVVGHSVGEVAAAQVAGALSREEAMRVSVHRGRCMDLASSRGKMLAVGCSLNDAMAAIRGREDRVTVAAHNSPRSVTLSGSADVLQELSATFEERGVFSKFLRVEYAFHSPQMAPVQRELLHALNGLEPRLPKLTIVSTVTGEPADDRNFDRQYWWQNVRSRVRFAEAIGWLAANDYQVFGELSPHPVLAASIRECLIDGGKKATIVSSLRREEPERASMLGSLGALYTIGYPLDWKKLWPRGGDCVRLPRYAWQRKRYWHEDENLAEMRLSGIGHPLIRRQLASPNPAWEITLDKRLLPYLKDHCLQRHAVVPAAAYLELALGVARDSLGASSCVLEDVQFQRALFLPEADDPPAVQFVYYPRQASYGISSRTSASEESWTLHAIGSLRVPENDAAPEKADLERIQQRLPEEISSDQCYQQFLARGLNYGPSFRGIERIWRTDGEALGRVRLPDPVAGDAEKYCLHPALLDACLQVLSGALPLDAEGLPRRLYLPARTRRVHFFGKPGSGVWAHVHLTSANPGAITADVYIYDPDGTPKAEILGFTCHATEGLGGQDQDDLNNWFYEDRWQLKPIDRRQAVAGSVDFLPSTDDIMHLANEEALEAIEQQMGKKRMAQSLAEIDRLSMAYIWRALRKLGWHAGVGDRVVCDALLERLNVVPQHQKLVSRFLQIMEAAGYLRRLGKDAFVVDDIPGEQELTTAWKRTLWRNPAFLSELTLIARCGPRLADVLRGQIDPLTLIFPGGSTATAEHFYQDSPSFRFYNAMVGTVTARAVERLPRSRTVRVLEVGAGSGGMTTYVLPHLPADRTEYVFSDISQVFLSKAEQKFRDYPFVEFKPLNIEEDPLEQGFRPHSFDMILASNVLHATRDLRASLGNIRKLLASRGLFVLLELETAPVLSDLVFGLMEGWWRFEDFDLRPDHALIPRDSWHELLEEAGFSEVAVSTRVRQWVTNQIVLLGRGPCVDAAALAVEDNAATPPPVRESGTWLIFADDSGLGRQLAGLLEGQGDSCLLVARGEAFERVHKGSFRIDPGSLEDMQQLVQHAGAAGDGAWKGTVHLWSLDIASPEHTTIDSLREAEVIGCHSVMHFVQALSRTEKPTGSPRLVLVTRGAQRLGLEGESTALGQAPLVGLGRIIANEFSEIDCKLVDLDGEDRVEQLHALVAELDAEDQEEEVALRGEARFVPRLERVATRKIPARQAASDGTQTRPFRLEVSANGVIDNLALRETRPPRPGPGQVTIKVCAAGLNFRDVLKALALDPTEEDSYNLPGNECAGTVVAVGEGVTQFQAGDEVMALAPACLGSYTTSLAQLVLPKPPQLTFEEAATVPVTFLTCYYALHHLAGVRPGESVLIHSGTGGVGLTSIQIAQQVGAEVLATAGNSEKRDFLRSLGVPHVMDSRSLEFADQVLKITGGRGVDIVVNALAGQAIGKGISCLAPYGRFVELGKADIYQNSKLDLWPFRKNLSLFAVDLVGLTLQRPEVVESVCRELYQLFSSGELGPLPHRVFPISRSVDAFRHVAQARHIGKVVLSLRDRDVMVEPAEGRPVAFRPDVSYLITGGFGGFGLTLARWLIERGARNLVLMSRSGDASQDARDALRGLRTTGARVLVVKSDVASQQQVARAFQEMERTMPPLKGIFHTAMVLDDGILLHLNRERFSRVMAPKVQGAWNLHTQSADKELDLFVLFSSASSLVGNPGQGNYVAANAFLDALAHYRRSLGLPAIAINWGQLTEVGVVARNQEISELLNRRGILGFSPKQAMQGLDRILREGPIQVGVMRMNWQQFAAADLVGKHPQRLSALVQENAAEHQTQKDKGWMKEVLLKANPEERETTIRAYLSEEFARVLGISAAKLDPERPLAELGLDSLMAVELMNRLENGLALPWPTQQLAQNATVHSLSKAVLDQLGRAVSDSSGKRTD